MAAVRREAGDPIAESIALGKLRTPEAYAETHSIGEYANPFKGMRVLRTEKPGTPVKPRVLSLAQDGIKRGYLAITEAPDGTPTSLTVVTKIPNPESDQLGSQYGFMITRDPESGVISVKGGTSPLRKVSDEFTEYSPKDAERMYAQVAEHGQPLDPAQVLLETASIISALNNVDAANHFGSLAYVQQLLRETRATIMNTGLPSETEAPLPKSGTIKINTFDSGNSEAHVDFRMQTPGKSIGDHYTVAAGLDSDYITVTNETRGITYFTDGETTTMYTPFGSVEIGGLESVPVLRGMNAAINQAIRAVDFSIQAYETHSASDLEGVVAQAQQAITHAIDNSHPITRILPNGWIKNTVRTLKDRKLEHQLQHAGEPKDRTPLTKKEEARLAELEQEVREANATSSTKQPDKRTRKTQTILSQTQAHTQRIESALAGHTESVETNEEVGSVVIFALHEARRLVNQLRPHGEVVLEEGKRAEAAITRDQMLYAIESGIVPTVRTAATLPFITRMGEGTVRVMDGKVVTDVRLLTQSLMLSLDPQSGKALLTRRETDGSRPTSFAPLSRHYTLSATIALIDALHRQAPYMYTNKLPDASMQEVPTSQGPEAVTRAFLGASIDHLVGPLMHGDVPVKLALELDPTEVDHYRIIGTPIVEGQAKAPYDRFVLSIPTLGNSRKIRLVVQQGEETTEVVMSRNLKTGTRALFVEHPYAEGTTQRVMLGENEPAADHLRDFAGRLVKALSAYDPYHPEKEERAEEQQELAHLFGRDALSYSEIEGLDKIQTVLRMFGGFPLQGAVPVEEDWATTPGEIPAIVVDANNSESETSTGRADSWVRAQLERMMQLALRVVGRRGQTQQVVLDEEALQAAEEARAQRELATETSWLIN